MKKPLRFVAGTEERSFFDSLLEQSSQFNFLGGGPQHFKQTSDQDQRPPPKLTWSYKYSRSFLGFLAIVKHGRMRSTSSCFTAMFLGALSFLLRSDYCRIQHDNSASRLFQPAIQYYVPDESLGAEMNPRIDLDAEPVRPGKLLSASRVLSSSFFSVLRFSVGVA